MVEEVVHARKFDEGQREAAYKLSASQLATYKDCPRKWYFDKVEGIERSETKATAEGTAIHSEVEGWYLNGVAPTRPTARALLSHLPKPGDGSIYVEDEVSLVWPSVEPVLVRGYIDLLWIRDGMSPRVHDHKTTSQKRYIKTVDDLRTDPQVLIYGLAARIRQAGLGYRPSNTIENQWTYVVREDPKTRPPHSEAVSFTQTLSELEEGLRLWSPTVTELVQIAKRGKSPLNMAQTRADQSACYKYGVCPYNHLCPDFAGRKEEPMSPDILARLAAASNSPMTVKTPEPVTPTQSEPMLTAPDPTPVYTPPKMPLLDTLRALESSQQPVIPPDAQPNVSENDPPPPPVAEVKRGRGRPKAVTAPTPELTRIPPADQELLHAEITATPKQPTSAYEPRPVNKDDVTRYLRDQVGLLLLTDMEKAVAVVNFLKVWQ